MKKICFVVAIAGTADSFLRDHIHALAKEYEVYIAGNIRSADEVARLEVKDFFRFDIHREISLVNDIKAVWQLYGYLKRMRFDAVHSVTPKAGLTAAIAARMAGVPHRIHIFTGQVWATRTGAMRWLLKSIDKVTAALDNHVLVDGESQRRFIVSNGVVSDEKSLTLGDGSISGVNTVRFNPSEQARRQVRTELGLDGKVVFAFMGRANREKGIDELFAAFDGIAASHPDAFLLFFGSDEDGRMDTLPQYHNIEDGKNFRFFGRTMTPELHLQAADVFVMPSYREGFGSSVIEASCLGLPVICSDAYGIMDAMVDGETGLRCRVADVPSLRQAMEALLADEALRRRLGAAGRQRVLDKFSAERLTAEWLAFYHRLLN